MNDKQTVINQYNDHAKGLKMFFIYMLLNTNITHAQETNYLWRWDKNAEIKYEICQDSTVKKEKIKAYVYYMIEEYDINVKQKEISVYYNNNCPIDPGHNTHYDETVFIKSFQRSTYQMAYAKTHVNWTKYDGIKYINNATIKFPNNLDSSVSDIVLLHEIGHSLGLGHDDSDDIMSTVIHRD